jgi:hypothetical protein
MGVNGRKNENRLTGAAFLRRLERYRQLCPTYCKPVAGTSRDRDIARFKAKNYLGAKPPEKEWLTHETGSAIAAA